MDYKEWVIQKAKELRMNPTKSELDFLNWVKKNYSSTPCFQYPIEANGKWFILDFYFKSLNIAIEIDGGIHKNQIEKDKNRDKILFEKMNIYTIRIDNKFCKPEVLNERFESKINYATSVLKKYGKKTGVLKRKKVSKNTSKPEKDTKQFAINIYNKNKNYHSDYYSYKIYNNLV